MSCVLGSRMKTLPMLLTSTAARCESVLTEMFNGDPKTPARGFFQLLIITIFNRMRMRRGIFLDDVKVLSLEIHGYA